MTDKKFSTRGRPREFDEAAALQRAILVFRERGFHGTSIVDLSGGMKLSSGSIYKAFKDKRGVFVAALDHYLSIRNDKIRILLREHQSPREQLQALLQFYIESSHLEEGRLGCMVVGTAIELATHDSEIKLKVGNALDRNEKRLADLIRQGQEQGEIGADVDASATAQLMLALFQGLRVLGKSRHEAADMTGVVKTAMRLLV